MRLRNGFAILTGLLALSVCAGSFAPASAQLVPGDHAKSLTFDGLTRFYDVHVPPGYDGTAPVPLVLDFHGYLSNKSDQADVSGFKTLSDVEGFVVVHPLGLYGSAADPEAANGLDGPSWNGGDLCCGKAARLDAEDVGFARALLPAVAAEANIDLRRVYATGLSNGGAMSHRLACEAANTFAATAPLAFPIPFSPVTKCSPSRPISVLHFAGTDDTLVPYEGGAAAVGGTAFPSAAESFDQWRSTDVCGDGAPDQVVTTGASTCETYTSCAEGVETGLCSIDASDDPPFPGHVLYWNDDLVLAEVAWDFLSRFTLPGLCDPLPAEGCRTAGKAGLSIKDRDEDTKDQLKWSWRKGAETLLAALGDPVSGTEYALCVYDSSSAFPYLAAETTIPAGAGWAAKGATGFQYSDKSAASDGVAIVKLKSGPAGKAQIKLKAVGAALSLPPAFNTGRYFDGDAAVVAQLVNADGECWTSSFTSADTKKNAGSAGGKAQFKAKSKL